LCLICRVIPKQTENRFCQFPNGGDVWKYHNWPKLIWAEHQSVWQHLFGNTVGERIRHVICRDLGNLSLKISYICIYVYRYIGIYVSIYIYKYKLYLLYLLYLPFFFVCTVYMYLYTARRTTHLTRARVVLRLPERHRPVA
jgi:hypothetical protein